MTENQRSKSLEFLRAARLSLGGAVLGVAVTGWLAPHLGIEPHTTTQFVGAAGGTALSALVLKLVHII